MWSRVDFGPIELFVLLGVALVGVVVMLWRLPRYWRGELTENEIESFRSEGMSEVRQAFVRSLPLICVTTVPFSLGLLGPLWSEITGRGATEAPLWANLAGAFWVIGVISDLVLTYTIIYFNKPRWIVPPRLRDEPGVNELRRRRGELARYRRRAFVRSGLMLAGVAAVIAVLLATRT